MNSPDTIRVFTITSLQISIIIYVITNDEIPAKKIMWIKMRYQ